MEELLSDGWEVELELINWRSWPPRPEHNWASTCSS